MLVVNHAHNAGDAMCQMRGLQEFKERTPGLALDFITCYPLHYLMATHTDLFESVTCVNSAEEVVQAMNTAGPRGYERVIEFTVDWAAACDHGILKAWSEKTLGFSPSTDQPYFLVRDEERVTAAANAHTLRHGLGFRKLALLQFRAPSDYQRSFRTEDWNRVLDLFPTDVGLVYPGPIELAVQHPFTPRPNLILLPGYDIGTTAALIEQVDYVFGVHGGTIMLAHAVGKQDVTQVMFLAAGSPNLLHVPAWDNLCYADNQQTNWEEVAAAIGRRLA
jgi:hypothetical protein